MEEFLNNISPTFTWKTGWPEDNYPISISKLLQEEAQLLQSSRDQHLIKLKRQLNYWSLKTQARTLFQWLALIVLKVLLTFLKLSDLYTGKIFHVVVMGAPYTLKGRKKFPNCLSSSEWFQIIYLRQFKAKCFNGQIKDQSCRLSVCSGFAGGMHKFCSGCFTIFRALPFHAV